MEILFPLAFAILCAVFANSKGRNAVGWFVLGLFFNLFALILLAVLPDLKVERKRWEHTSSEQYRQRERTSQERQRREAFERHTLSRLDAHDTHAGIDTRAGAPPPLPAQLAAAEPTWYYEMQGASRGPVAHEELAEKFAVGALPPTTLVWREGMDDWQPANRVGGLT